jgi:hypothetical protein
LSQVEEHIGRGRYRVVRELEVTNGTGVVSHAGLALLYLADKIGLMGGLSRALAAERILVHDRPGSSGTWPARSLTAPG